MSIFQTKSNQFFLLFFSVILILYSHVVVAAEWLSSGLAQENIIVLRMSPSKPEILYAGTMANGIFKTEDAGKTWTAMNKGIAEKRITDIAMHPIDNNRVYAAVGGRKIYASQDGGQSWTVNDTSFATDTFALFQVTRVAVDAENANIVYAGGLDDGIWRSSNGGKDFSLLSQQLKNFPADKLITHPQKAGFLYVETASGSIWGSTDGSKTWIKLTDGLANNSLNAFAAGLDHAYVLVKDNGLYRVAHGAKQWQLINKDRDVLAISDLLVAGETQLYAISGEKIIYSEDSGQTWQQFIAVVPKQLKNLVSSRKDAPLYATSSLGLFQYQANQALTISPLSAHIGVGQTVDLSANGGKGQYFWQADGGKLDVNGNKARFTLPKIGTFYVWLSDGKDIVWSLIDSQVAADAPMAVYITPTKISLDLTETRNITVRALHVDFSQTNVTNQATFSVVNPSIAAVSALGVITPKAAGKTNIVATYKGLSSTLALTVTDAVTLLEIEPALIELYEGGQAQALKVYLIRQSGLRELYEKATLTLDDTAVASLNGNQISGLKRGSTQLNLSANNTSLKIPVVVLPVTPLRVTPSTAVAQVGEELGFAVTGGFPPYTVTVDQGTSRQQGAQVFYQHNQAGTAHLTISDSNAQQTSATITINQALFVSPQQSITTAGEQVLLEANGGSGDYQWHTTQGNLSNTTGNSTTFIAPNRDGIYTVTVTDGAAFTQAATIVVGKAMYLSPEQLYLDTNETATVTILGGEPLYQATVTAGQAIVKDKTIEYTAPAAAGFYHLDLTDSVGNNKSVTVTVGLDLLLTPKAGRIKPEATLVLQAAGGFGGKHWVASKGLLDTNKGDKVTWTAPKVFGPVQIHVMDDAGAIASAMLEVSNDNMVVSPSAPHIFMQTEAEFSAIGGGAPYTWVVEAGDTKPNETGDSISYTAPAVKGSYSITVTDNAGLTAIANADVYSSKLMVSPKTLYINQGESAEIALAGGTGSYTVWADAGQMDNDSLALAEDETQITAVYQTKYSVSDSDRITVMDSAGNIALVKINIQNSVEAQKIWKLVTTYAGEDQQIDAEEMEKGLEDFFVDNGIIDKKTLYWMLDAFGQD